MCRERKILVKSLGIRSFLAIRLDFFCIAKWCPSLKLFFALDLPFAHFATFFWIFLIGTLIF